ncbi:MAG: CHASE3 domain-containing protein [Proteobacteria bacterium]|nr:CHASE3 domain-containing protein [Pseudomonadota bacterium]
MRGRPTLTPLWPGLAFIVAPSLALAVLSIVQLLASAPELQRGRERVVHTFEVITTAQALERAMQDAERGQRGFLITGDAAYLDPYRSGAAAVPALLAKLRQLTADNSEQQRRMPVLENQIDVKLTVLQRMLAASEKEGFDAARQIMQTNVGLDAMRGVDAVIDAVIAAENALLIERQARAGEDERTAALVAGVSGALALSAVVLGVIVVVRGFRTIRDAEAATRGSEEQLRRLIDGVADHALFMLDPTGRVSSWNAGAERLKGYRADEILGQHFSVFFTDEDRAANVPDQVLQAAARGDGQEAEAWRVRKDGSRFPASVAIDAVHDQAGALVGFAKLTHDISERLAAQQALEETRARLAQAQKMEALGQLTGGIAHDFNNMLHVMIGSIETLHRHAALQEPGYRQQLDIALEGGRRAATLTRQLLAFARQQPLQPRALDPNKLVSGMTDLLRRTLGETVAIETVLAGGMWWTSADANQLESAILNLALNARDAMPHGGKLTIETANSFLDEAYARGHAEVAAGQYAMIAVSDSGTGMSHETIEKAFDPFFTTKEAGAGTGLGLSQVFGFVKQSGGHVKIYSELGDGTTVKLYLPRHAAGPEAPGRPSAAAPVPIGSQSEAVLVVEDDEPARTYCTALLSELGYRVVAAPDGPTALSLLDADPAIDLLFTDVGLPGGMNGRQLADKARLRRPGLKVLFTTAYARNAIVHQGRLDPGVELLGKPFTYAELGAKIRRVLAGEA